jgi:fumarate reductase iron-sulfur subunit
MTEPVTFEIQRYRPEVEDEPTWESFGVLCRSEWMILDALNHIKDHVDGSLSYRWACRMGVCGSCGMLVNGEPVLTCATYVNSVLPGPVRVEPLRGFPVMRDLVNDITDFVRKLESVKPWIVRKSEKPLEEGEYLQTPEEMGEYEQYSMCINCMLCYSACPIYELEPDFLGPAVIALAQRYNLDSRDEGSDKRMDILSRQDGIWCCTFVGECSAVCPKNVDPAGAIQRLKVTATVHAFKSLLMPWAGR